MSKQAIGMIETKGFCALVEGCDAALKSADVTMTGWVSRIGGGLVAAFFVGDVAAVNAGVEAAAEAASQMGEVNAIQVIPRPHDDLCKLGDFINS